MRRRLNTFWRAVQPYLPIFIGLVLIGAYWLWARPLADGQIGYSEDFCSDLPRQLMAENLQRHGSPVFWTDRLMAPAGAAIPFMSWSIERDWLGAYAWMWDRSFPFLWVYFGLSMVVSFLGVGFILRKMGLVRVAAWGLALLVVLFHVPRHFKTYYHFEHLPQHWIYFSLFLDAWIWQRFWRERKWSWNLELWRGVCMLGMLLSTGYFWGPLILEWILVRLCLGAIVVVRWQKREKTDLDGTLRGAIFPSVLGIALLAIELRWLLPLAQASGKLGDIFQPIGWLVDFDRVIEPLWFRPIFAPFLRLFPTIRAAIPALDSTETVMTIGWLFWVPVVLGLNLIRKKKGGAGCGTVLPFLIFLLMILRYAVSGKPYFFRDALQAVIPFMSFFRVGSRMGLFLPAVTGVLIVLAWPELKEWFLRKWREYETTGKKRFRVGVGVFVVLSCIELSWLVHPIKYMPPMDSSVKKMMTDIRNLSGSLVLDMPFCVAGGNGVCTGQQCPNYPESTVGQCLRQSHDKAIFGLYQARMVGQHCQIFNRAPFLSWFEAWRNQRCFTDQEWGEFCSYLEATPEMAAVLVYPGIWKAAAEPECRRRFDEMLGAPLGEGSFVTKVARGGVETERTSILWYRPRCQPVR